MEIQQVMGSPCKITQQEARREVESQVFIFCLFAIGKDILFILYMYEKIFFVIFVIFIIVLSLLITIILVFFFSFL